MTKEEKIKEVLKDKFELVKDFICLHSGEVSDRQYYQLSCPHPSDLGLTLEEVETFWTRKDDGEKMVDVFNWIHVDLKGLEDNNGWLKIESEDDLPKEDCNVFILHKTYGIITDKYKSAKQDFHYNCKNNITHYQIIEKPKPPII